MSEHVWITGVLDDERYIKPVWSETALTREDAELAGNAALLAELKEKIDLEREAANFNKGGSVFDASRFPPEMSIYRNPMDPPETYDSLPLFCSGSFIIAAAACAEVLSKYDLVGGLYPVKICQQDRKTPVPGTYFHLNIGASKKAVLPEQSPGLEDMYGMGYMVSTPLKDDEIAVSPEALVGADLWVDPILSGTMFFSDRLWKALKAAKVHAPFRAKRCRVVTD